MTLWNGIKFFHEALSEEVVSIAMPVKSVSNNHDKQLIAQIPAGHLFGEAAPNMGNLAETRLKLELNGIMLGSRQENSYAIISTGQGQKLYRPGETLPGGAKLYQITAEGIVIQHQGKFEQLQLPRPQSLLNGGKS